MPLCGVIQQVLDEILGEAITKPFTFRVELSQWFHDIWEFGGVMYGTSILFFVSAIFAKAHI